MTKMYAKDSMDRFGDDLCEELLSYLPLEDKFGVECVSQQFRRCVFGGHRELILYGNSLAPKTVPKRANCSHRDKDNAIDDTKDNNEINTKTITVEEIFRSILQKCPNVTKIEYNFGLNNALLDIIINYGHNLRDFYWDSYRITDQMIDDFFARFAGRLTRLAISSYYRRREPLVRHVKQCQNLRSVDIKHALGLRDLLAITSDDSGADTDGTDTQSMPKMLRTFRCVYGPQDSSRFGQFVDYCRQNLRSLDVTVEDHCDQSSMNNLMVSLSRLHLLVDLRLTLPTITGGGHLAGGVALQASQLRQLGADCRHLKSLCLNADANTGRQFAAIMRVINDRFPGLKRLEIGGEFMDTRQVSVRSLAGCRRLSRLVMNVYFGATLKPEFFADFGTYLPRVHHLSASNVFVTNQTMRCLSTGRRLKYVRLNGCALMSDDSVRQLIHSCPKLQEVFVNDKHFL